MSGALGRIAHLDAKAISAVQMAYEYTLDRWGLLVGSFRALAVCACFSVTLLSQYFSADSSVARLMVLGVWAFAFIPSIAATLIRPHLEKDNKLQEARRFVSLNVSAMLHQDTGGFFVRFAAFIVVCLVHFCLSQPSLDGVASTTFLMVWLWSRAVTVRDRDEARFRKASARFAPVPHT
jgi:hypothetical protein